jgi:hypothetical protein
VIRLLGAVDATNSDLQLRSGHQPIEKIAKFVYVCLLIGYPPPRTI